MNTPDASTAIPPVLPESGTLTGWLRRFGFRFLAFYLLQYNVVSLIGPIPGLNQLGWLIYQVWDKFVPWAGTAIFHLAQPITIKPNGSGDTTFNYVQILCMLLLTLAVTLVWVWFDRRRRYDPIVREATRITVRYVLALTMLSYGISKMLHQQMPAPMLSQLQTSYGEFSPMGLLWRFMGYSATYSFFAGFCEFLGGLLLFFRRTTTLGALLVAAVMFHVALMNFCFDVPVKIYSTHLFLFAVFLLAPDLRRLADVFFWHRAVPAVPFALTWPRRWMHFTALGIKVLFVGYTLYYIPVARTLAWLQTPPRPELYGLYETKEFIYDGAVIPETGEPNERWRRFVFTEYGANVELMNGRRVYYTFTSSLKDRQLKLTWRGDQPVHVDLAIERPSPDTLKMSGPWYGHTVAVELTRVDDTKFTLLNRGFRWINEYPFNR